MEKTEHILCIIQAANEAAFGRLYSEVGALRGKLRLFDDLNASMATDNPDLVALRQRFEDAIEVRCGFVVFSIDWKTRVSR